MISMLIYNELEREKKMLHSIVKDAAAFATDERWSMTTVGKLDEVELFLKELPLLDIACMEVTKGGTIKLLEKMRKSYMEMFLLVISDMSVSPMSYMRPSIMPSSLLLRPCTEEDIRRIVNEMVEAYLDRIRDTQDNGRSFVVDTREGKTYIPYEQIFCFESRAKKVFLRTKSEEYGFYDTIENLEKDLPDFFMRCHRSFIINTRKIQKVFLSQNTVTLHGNMEIPLSRSYKPALKEFGRK